MRSRFYSVLTLILIAVISAGCGTQSASSNKDANPNPNTAPNKNSGSANTNIGNNNGDFENSSESNLPPLPMEPQVIDLEIPDGRVLEGLYYPAAVNPAPTILLLHMAGASKADWGTIAPWLQNRGLEPEGKGNRTWFDPTWFPELPEDVSFNVFTFTFGGFSGSPGGDWLDFPLEALTAMLTLSELEGVDPYRITTMGTSIGADTAASSCYQFNSLVEQNQAEGRCLGSVSLSPGNYLLGGDHLDLTYQEVVAAQQTFDFPVMIYCLAAEKDSGSPATCLGAQKDGGTSFFPYIFPGKDHGMYLIKQDAKPSNPASESNTLEIYLHFLNEVYELGLNP